MICCQWPPSSTGRQAGDDPARLAAIPSRESQRERWQAEMIHRPKKTRTQEENRRDCHHSFFHSKLVILGEPNTYVGWRRAPRPLRPGGANWQSADRIQFWPWCVVSPKAIFEYSGGCDHTVDWR